eukprot:229054-Rhodomonas_salina.2
MSTVSEVSALHRHSSHRTHPLSTLTQTFGVAESRTGGAFALFRFRSHLNHGLEFCRRRKKRRRRSGSASLRSRRGTNSTSAWPRSTAEAVARSQEPRSQAG